MTKKIRVLPTEELKISQYKDFVKACKKNERKAMTVMENDKKTFDDIKVHTKDFN